MGIRWELTRHGARWIAILIVLAGVPQFFSDRATHVAGDGMGYSLYVRSLVVHGALAPFGSDSAPTEESVASRTMQRSQLEQAAAAGGRILNQYPAGPSLLWLPGYSLCHLLLKLGHSLGFQGLPPTDGYSFPYRYIIGIATIGAAVLSLLMISSLLTNLTSPVIGTIALALAYWATPAYHYTIYESSMSEIPSMFSVTLFFWLWRRVRSSRLSSDWVAWGASLGLAVVMRYQHLVLGAIALLAVSRARSPGQSIRVASQFLAGLFPVVAIQVFVWRATSGRWAPAPYSTGIETLWAFDPTMLLFSARKGLFASHPIWILATLGLILGILRSRNREFLSGMLGFSLFLLWINQLPTDFWAGFSYGGRRFLPALLPCAVGIALSLELGEASIRRFPRLVLVMLLLPLIWLSARSRMDIQNNPTVASLGVPQMPKLISQLEKAYKRNGWPFSWPANLLWANRNQTTPDRFDYGAALFADNPGDLGGRLAEGGFRVECSHSYFPHVVREHPVERALDGIAISQPTTIWLNLSKLPRPYALRFQVGQMECCKPITVRIEHEGREVWRESLGASAGSIGPAKGIHWVKGTNRISLQSTSPIILRQIDLLEADHSR